MKNCEFNVGDILIVDSIGAITNSPSLVYIGQNDKFDTKGHWVINPNISAFITNYTDFNSWYLDTLSKKNYRYPTITDLGSFDFHPNVPNEAIKKLLIRLATHA